MPFASEPLYTGERELVPTVFQTAAGCRVRVRQVTINKIALKESVRSVVPWVVAREGCTVWLNDHTVCTINEGEKTAKVRTPLGSFLTVDEAGKSTPCKNMMFPPTPSVPTPVVTIVNFKGCEKTDGEGTWHLKLLREGRGGVLEATLGWTAC